MEAVIELRIGKEMASEMEKLNLIMKIIKLERRWRESDGTRPDAIFRNFVEKLKPYDAVCICLERRTRVRFQVQTFP